MRNRRRFFFFCNISRASGENSGATITSLKISDMAAAVSPSSGWLTAIIPPYGAWRSVAKAFCQASAKVFPCPAPHGFVCFRIASVGASPFEFRDEACGSGQIQNVVIGELFAVELLEELLKSAIEGGSLDEDSHRSATVEPRARLSQKNSGVWLREKKLSASKQQWLNHRRRCAHRPWAARR